MAGDFGQFRVQERQLSDIEAVQSPVQDTSSATKMSAFAQGLESLGKTGIVVAKGIQDRDEEIARVQAEEAQVKAKKEFEQELLRGSLIAEQKGNESPEFKSFLRKAYASSGLDPDSKSKMLKDFQGTVLGKVFTETSPEQRAFDEITQGAVKAGFISKDATPEEVELGTVRYQQVLAQAQLISATKSSLELEQAQFNLQTSRDVEATRLRKESLEDLKRQQQQALRNLASGHTGAVKNQVNTIVQQYRDGVIDKKTATEALKSGKRDISATAGQLAAGLPTNFVDPLVKPMLEVFDLAAGKLDDSSVLEDIKVGNDLMVAKAQRNQLVSSPDLVNYIANSTMVNHQSPAIIAKTSEESLRVLNGLGVGVGKPSDVTRQDEGTSHALLMVGESIRSRDLRAPDGRPRVDAEELLTTTSNILKSAGRYVHEDDNPNDNAGIIKWLADPAIGEYVKENISKMPTESAQGLTDTLVKSAVNHLYPKVQDITSSDLKDDEGVEMMNLNGQVMFRATSGDPWHMSVAKRLNDQIAGALTSYFKAIANVSSDDFNQVFERERPTAWPSKYGFNEGDGTYTDPNTGQQFEVVNGKRVD